MEYSVLTVEVPIFNMIEITEDITVLIKDVQLDTKKLLPILITQKQSINGLMKTTERATIFRILKIIFVKFRLIYTFATILLMKIIKNYVRLFVRMCMRTLITPLIISWITQGFWKRHVNLFREQNNS